MRSSSPTKLNILIQYLDQSPIFSAQYLDYQDPKGECHKLIINNLHLTNEGRAPWL